ncbi:DUF2339 domain-containing protein [Microvirga thermotolerans]|uniref:DUF2339 domain-containing protein n=1 Tax=Microvirga thermotolerans TaxID=2651334 RepID=A0A5P9K0W4_9HYPH|nr:DUF2339 domain-containing protein [Microvirga thermotolerans]QFU15864.1 DUF2339 domain-containing protein [Microvirga thermotolerans]
MDDIEVLLLVLLALAFPVSAVAGLVLAIRARRSIALLTLRLERLEDALRAGSVPVVSPAPAAPSAAPEQEEAGPEPAPREPEPPEPEAPRASVPGIAAAPPVAPSSGGRDLEARLGTRWAVWVGGLALALGGLFLVRYSIEQGLLSPMTRILLGGLFALGLAGAGEWLRRREGAVSLPGFAAAHVPSILTAAGTCTAFASAYAAYALYDLIGPGTTFVLLGIVAVLAMVAATLHGPALAALGLLGAMGSPLLVSSEEPQPWALTIYLAFAVLPAYGVAWLRLWRWLALAGTVGALLWALPILWIGGSDVLPAMAHLAVQTALAAFLLGGDPRREVSDGPHAIDWPESLVLLAFALAATVVASAVAAGEGRPVFVGTVALTLLAAGLRIPQRSPAAAWAALACVGALTVWPIGTLLGRSPENLFYQSGDAFAVRPDALGTYLAFAAVSTPAIAVASLLRLARSRGLRLPVAAWYAGAAGAGPLLALVAAYWRVAEFERSLSFAVVAGVLALVFTLASQWLVRGGRTEEDAAVRLGLGATASAALGAIALGLTFALEKGMLTVAFALSALATAWVANRVAIPALRYATGAIGLVVLGRLAWNPTIVGGDPGPVLANWLLWGYGIPAAAFFLASRLLERTGRDAVVRLAESLAIVFAAFLVFFEIRHALNGGDPLSARFGLLEAGLVATESLAFALLLTRLDLARSDPVYRWGSLAFKAVSVLLTAGGLLAAHNPLLTGEPVPGGAFLNALLPAYLLPAALSLALARQERRARPAAFAWISAILGLLLLTAFAGLQIRRIVQGPGLGFWLGFGQGEQWAYSVTLLGMGILLLGAGLWRDNRFARLASAVYLVLAVLKVFIVDLANLEGVMRALSFIGLGLVLIGIGLVYQRLFAQRPADAAATR